MAAVVLFGATGYTGRLTAHALARRGVDFSIAGRDRAKLEILAGETGGPGIAVAQVGDVSSLVDALEGARVLVTCVGPFMELGDTAAEAALRAGCHYIDSTGEVGFLVRLIDKYGDRARDKNIAIVPSFGFDEVPADLAVTLACEGMSHPNAVLTYATSRSSSVGTIKSIMGIIATGGWWIEDGQPVPMQMGRQTRWAPMPPPLGVRMSVGAPLAIARLAPLHINFRSLQVYATLGRIQHLGLKMGMPIAAPVARMGWVRDIVGRATEFLPEGPGPESRRAKWTVLAEARSADTWRNVVVTGRDLYGTTAELLAAGADILSAEEVPSPGVLSPVQAVGLEHLQKEMIDLGDEVKAYEAE